MNLKEAKEITGGLSSPSKMPGYAYNLPAWQCVTGVKLQAVAGSVCSGCYAMKGRYRFPNVKDALNRRLNSLTHPQWVEAMTVLVLTTASRFHSSGGMTQETFRELIILKKFLKSATSTQQVQHWMPTREAKLLTLMDPAVVPKNLIIRMSSHMIDQAPVKFWPHTSTVVRAGKTCPAQENNNQCGSCRQLLE